VLAVLVWAAAPPPGPPDRPIGEVWADHADRAERALDRLLHPWREAYPEVELTGTTTDRHAVAALLDHAQGAELLVVPRGDLACAVVEYAECPVAVV
jgi:broad specificity phosphatase PhoE